MSEVENFDEIEDGISAQMFAFINGQSDVVPTADDLIQMEQFAIGIVKLRERQEFLRKLKEHRVNPIDEAISSASEREERLQNACVAILQKMGKKSTDFPGVAKLVSRNVKGKWQVDNEEKVLEFLAKENKLDECTSRKIRKKELDEVLDTLATPPEGISKTDPRTTISVTVHTGTPVQRVFGAMREESEPLSTDGIRL
jgi:hypothetical protein